MTASLPVIWHDEIDSTNEEAKRRAAEAGPVRETWIAARRQSAGRGRMGRGWVSPEGNLYATVLLSVPGGPTEALKLPFVAALAAHDAASGFAPAADIRLKWPNDLRVDGKKLCGILVEAGEADGAMWAVVGIGMNVAHVPEGAGQAATCLADLAGRLIEVDAVLDGLREAMAARWDAARGDFSATLAAWLERAEGLGEAVRAHPGGEPVEGIFETLDADGGLVLRLPDGERRTIRAGDVELVKQV